ncbi:MAG: hypothetical protein LBT37_08210 [Lactobacillaceae bacterium]|jgi:hypothetical protein|nr:hypothetical protein [Lactobacillaceae bacterium]
MRKKIIIVSLAGLAAVTALSLTAMNKTEAKYSGTRKITIQTDKVTQLTAGDYTGVVPKTGYYVVQMRGGDGGSGADGRSGINPQGGLGGYVEALYKLDRGDSIKLLVATAGSNSDGNNANRGGNSGNSVFGGLGGDKYAKGGAGGGASEFFVNNNRVAAAGGGGGAASGGYKGISDYRVNAGKGGSGGFNYEGATAASNDTSGISAQIGDGFRGETGLSGQTQDAFRGLGGYLSSVGRSGKSGATDGDYDGGTYYAHGGSTLGGAQGSNSGQNEKTLITQHVSGGGGGAGWFGGGGGSANETSTLSTLATKYAGAGGGGSSYAPITYAFSTTLNNLFASVKTNTNVDLAAYRAGIPTTGQVGGGNGVPGKAQIYFVGATLPKTPATDSVGTGPVTLGK